MIETIGVGAIHKFGERWNYSCFGSGLDVMAPTGEDEDFAWELGDQWTIDQTGNLGWNPNHFGSGDANGDIDYTSHMGGTSGACPQVAGVIALMLGKRPDLNPCDISTIREILANTSDDLGDPGWDEYYGYGRVNAFKAMVVVSRGDINNDGTWNVFDVVACVDQAFRGGDPPELHPGLSDMNCNQVTNVFDVVQIVDIAFRGGSHPEPCYEFDY